MFPATTKSGGVNVTTGPLDVCKTPSPGAPIPLPYANLVDGLAASGDKAAKRTQKKIIDDAARKGYAAKSATAAAIGDEAGTMKGLVSSKNMDKAAYKMGSSKIKAEGKGVVHMTSTIGHNGSSSNAPVGMQIAPSQSKVILMG